ncbi:hypothetical protein B0H17DRAFT_1056585, partial [Mycena rosella]
MARVVQLAQLETPTPVFPPQTRPLPEMLKPSTRMSPVLPVELVSCPVRPSLPLPTITFVPVPIALCPESPVLAASPPPATIEGDFQPPSVSPQPQRPLVRRSPSVPVLPAAPLSPVPEVPPAALSSAKKKTTKVKKRHSMVIRVAPLGSPVISAVMLPDSPSPALPSEKGSPEADSKGSSTFATEGTTAQVDFATAADDQPCRLPLSDVHNTATIAPAPTTKQEEILEIFDAPPPRPPSRVDLAALISPSKAPRRADRGPNPVYHYLPDTPAVAVAKSVARPVQDEFKNFSAALGAKFGLRGWAETGPNELAPPKKTKKKKKKAAAKGAHATPYPPVTVRGPRVSHPPSPSTTLLPAFEHKRADPVQYPPSNTPAPQDRERPRFVIDLTLPPGIARLAESVSSERAVSTGCHPDCADIYCPGGSECSGIKC